MAPDVSGFLGSWRLERWSPPDPSNLGDLFQKGHFLLLGNQPKQDQLTLAWVDANGDLCEMQFSLAGATPDCINRNGVEIRGGLYDVCLTLLSPSKISGTIGDHSTNHGTTEGCGNGEVGTFTATADPTQRQSRAHR